MMFIVISVVEFGTKISSLLPILLDLCKNMKMNYFDISLSELRSHDILSSTFVVVLSFWTIFQCKDFCCFHISLWMRSLLVRLGKLKKVLRQYYIFRIILQWKYFLFLLFSLNWDPSLWGWARGRAKLVQLHHRVRSWERFSIFVEIFEKGIFFWN